MIYLLGGHEDFAEALLASMQKEIEQCEYIVFVPTLADDLKESTLFMTRAIKAFKNMGFKNVYGDLLNRDTSSEDIKKKMIKADIIFLMDGHPKEQMAFIKEKSMMDLLKDSDKVIIGQGTGALNLCKVGILTDNQGPQKPMIYEGLNLTGGISVDVDYKRSKRKLIGELQESYGLQKVFGIPESCGILMNNDEMTFLGDKPVTLLMEDLPAMDIRYIEE